MKNGLATVCCRRSDRRGDAGPGTEPTKLRSGRSCALFLERYLNFLAYECEPQLGRQPEHDDRQPAAHGYAGMQKDDFIGKIEDDQTTSEFQLRSLSPPRTTSADVHGIRVLNKSTTFMNTTKAIDKVVSEFHVRLLVERRSEENPSGLLIGEYWERADRR